MSLKPKLALSSANLIYLKKFRNDQKCFARVWKVFEGLQYCSKSLLNVLKIFNECLEMFGKIKY